MTIIGPITNSFDAADLQTLASLGRQVRKLHLAGFSTAKLSARVSRSVHQGYSSQLAAITAVANACLHDHVIVAPTTPTTTPSPVASLLPSGIYTNGPSGTPHYFISLMSGSGGSFSGTVSFLAQDGNTPTEFTFTAAAEDGVATVTPSSGPSTLTATFSQNQLTLGNCTSYLQFAQSNADCTFNLSPGGLQ